MEQENQNQITFDVIDENTFKIRVENETSMRYFTFKINFSSKHFTSKGIKYVWLDYIKDCFNNNLYSFGKNIFLDSPYEFGYGYYSELKFTKEPSPKNNRFLIKYEINEIDTNDFKNTEQLKTYINDLKMLNNEFKETLDKQQGIGNYSGCVPQQIEVSSYAYDAYKIKNGRY